MVSDGFLTWPTDGPHWGPQRASVAPSEAVFMRHVNYVLKPVTIDNAKAKDKRDDLTDGGGLVLEGVPSGSKTWRFKYHLKGKREKVTRWQCRLPTFRQCARPRYREIQEAFRRRDGERTLRWHLHVHRASCRAKLVVASSWHHRAKGPDRHAGYDRFPNRYNALRRATRAGPFQRSA